MHGFPVGNVHAYLNLFFHWQQKYVNWLWDNLLTIPHIWFEAWPPYHHYMGWNTWICIQIAFFFFLNKKFYLPLKLFIKEAIWVLIYGLIRHHTVSFLILLLISLIEKQWDSAVCKVKTPLLLHLYAMNKGELFRNSYSFLHNRKWVFMGKCSHFSASEWRETPQAKNTFLGWLSTKILEWQVLQKGVMTDKQNKPELLQRK